MSCHGRSGATAPLHKGRAWYEYGPLRVKAPVLLSAQRNVLSSAHSRATAPLQRTGLAVQRRQQRSQHEQKHSSRTSAHNYITSPLRSRPRCSCRLYGAR